MAGAPSDKAGSLSGQAIVIGATGGIGGAIADELESSGQYAAVVRLSRRSAPPVDLTNEATIAAAAAFVRESQAPIRLIVVASGLLGNDTVSPEKSLRDLDPTSLAHLFAVNAIGPALIAKHFLPLLPRDGRSVFAALSARVGSIGDNRLGGWYGYRASKAALNQMIHTAAIELARTRPAAICVVLHPGTVATPLSAPFAKNGLGIQSPLGAAQRIIGVMKGLRAEDSGGFFDHEGRPIDW
ncbi:MAG: C-factor [Sphingomonadales bacterium]|nr:C-factor [Sphingomonadales bacterium]